MLKLVHATTTDTLVPFETGQELQHHNQLLDGFFQSQIIRNHSVRTIAKNKHFLTSWFKIYGSGRTLYTWEAMKPIDGRQLIVQYGKDLIKAELANQTIRTYLGVLRSYFDYVSDHPFVFTTDNKPIRIGSLYGAIEQPVSEYDIPQHSMDTSCKRRGIPIDPATLYDFYSVVRKHYLIGSYPHVRARNYTLVVLAGESGLRAEELQNLEIKKDLFFESKKLQTRYAKGYSGSGKRARTTLFTPIARDTVKFYLKHHRPHLVKDISNDYLFPSTEKTKKAFIDYQVMCAFLKEMILIANKNNFYVANHLSWHWFRRLFATRFIETHPTELPVLISLMGHRSFGTVHAYIQHSQAWMDKKIQEIVEKVDNAY